MSPAATRIASATCSYSARCPGVHAGAGASVDADRERLDLVVRGDHGRFGKRQIGTAVRWRTKGAAEILARTIGDTGCLEPLLCWLSRQSASGKSDEIDLKGSEMTGHEQERNA